MQRCHEGFIRPEIALIFCDDLGARAVSANDKRIAPLAGPSDVNCAFRYWDNIVNPIHDLDVDSPAVVDDAAQIAEALAIEDSRELYSAEYERDLLQMLVLYAVWVGRTKRGQGDLRSVRRLLLLEDEELRMAAIEEKKNRLEVLLQRIAEEKDAFGGVMARAAETFCEMSKKDSRALRMTFYGAWIKTQFLDSPQSTNASSDWPIPRDGRCPSAPGAMKSSATEASKRELTEIADEL